MLVDLNEFPPIFQKVQHSHSKHQITTSKLLRINLKGKLRFNNSWSLEGSMYIILWKKFQEQFSIWFQTKQFTRFFRTRTTL